MHKYPVSPVYYMLLGILLEPQHQNMDAHASNWALGNLQVLLATIQR